MNASSVKLRGETVLRRSDRVFEAHIDGESVLLDPDTGHYFAMNSVGATIWSLLERPMALATLEELVATEFAIAREIANRDCGSFVEELEAHGLVELEGPVG